MSPAPLSLDTPPSIEQMQVARWREMSPAEKLALAVALTQTVQELALAGVRMRHPDASPREQFLQLAISNLGRDLAARAYPEIDRLSLR